MQVPLCEHTSTVRCNIGRRLHVCHSVLRLRLWLLFRSTRRFAIDKSLENTAGVIWKHVQHLRLFVYLYARNLTVDYSITFTCCSSDVREVSFSSDGGGTRN